MYHTPADLLVLAALFAPIALFMLALWALYEMYLNDPPLQRIRQWWATRQRRRKIKILALRAPRLRRGWSLMCLLLFLPLYSGCAPPPPPPPPPPTLTTEEIIAEARKCALGDRFPAVLIGNSKTGEVSRVVCSPPL